MTRKVDRSFITDRVMKSYRTILEATLGHLENNDPSGVIKTIRGAKYRHHFQIISYGQGHTPWL